ncbi:MAG: O-antigen ligase [Clostridiaceae bacterium]|nr:O-antigen ligase [Clostridiaceae bacterium]
MNKKITKENKLILCFSIIISGLILFASSDNAVIIHIVALLLLVLTACILAKFDIYHPYVWYSSFFFIYSSAYPILYLIGYSTQYCYSKEIMIYQYIALSTILLVLPSYTISFENPKNFTMSKDTFLKIVENFVLAYILIALYVILKGAYPNKRAIYASGNIILYIAFSIAYFAILLYCYVLFKKFSISDNRYLGTIVKFGVVICSFAIVTGERDYMFTFILLTFIILFYFKKIHKWQLIALVPLGILLIPISNMFKYYILSGRVNGTLSTKNLLGEVLDGEFISAGRNLQILVSNNCNNLFKGKTLLNDFIRIFYDTGYSNQTWFNHTFFASSQSTQYGFTLVGEGYVNGGILGIIIVFLICGLLLRALYINANKNIYFMIIYLYMIPLFIYSIRADLANTFSPLIKYAIMGTLLIWIINHIVFKGKGRKSNEII